MSGSEDEAAPMTKAEFGRLLTAIVGIQDQMQSMKRELAEEREATNERLVKRIRLEKAPTFKKGHEKQFRCTVMVKCSAWCMHGLNRRTNTTNVHIN